MKHLALLLLLAGPLLAAERAAPRELITHEAADMKTAAAVRTGDQLKIVLPAKGDVGYAWQIIANDPRYLKPQGDVKPAADPKAAAGGAVPWAITFTAQRPGRSTVRFIYAPANATGEVTPTDTREIVVTVR
jgi:predicted secreted protein